MAEIRGACDERFESVRDALARNLDSGEELGASIVLDLDGDILIDMWGGFRDQDRTVPWTQDTITNVWSTTKTVTSLAALMLVDRGELDVDAPVARYWPQFAAAGKQDVLVRHVMSYASGVSGLDQPAVVEDLYDWERSTSRFAAQAPWWEPGTASGYHALNYGHLVGEIVRRISGKTLKQFVAEEIAGPLGAARSVARVMSVVARGGEVDGVRLLGPDTIDLIFREQQNGVDLVLGIPLRLGIGYGLPQRDTLPEIPDGKICFWGGWGGSMIVMDVGRRMTFAYMMNKMGAGIVGSERSAEYGRALYDAVTKLD